MPDRPQGYVRKGRGVLPPDQVEAKRYRARQKEDEARFDETAQRLLIEECIATADFRDFRLHGVATESTHVHVLISWRDERPFAKLCRGLRESLSRRLNSSLRRRWLAKDGSRKRVLNDAHYAYLMNRYLPKHSGWKWREGVGYYR
ncbi:MAG: hypothetical protein DCC67_05330 [Planctomycetota bacterium]|nr:MAG: hypothetical protein DCC67_05330 [Planctomycetota bacterium]